MSTYVLIHGAWHGAWCWYKLVPLLEQRGHRAVTLDLPGHGIDRSPPAEGTLRSYVDAVCKLLDAQPEPVVLVGHSLGGVSITQAAEHRPDKVQRLVYLCAFLPQNGQTLRDLSQADRDSAIGPHLRLSEDHRVMWVAPGGIRDVFYGDCSAEDVALARSLLVHEPTAPQMAPVAVTDANFGRVPRVYIECMRDRAIGPPLQKAMYTATPCERVITFDSDHSPFFSCPAALADALSAV
jgi:pimeloyl-ACP methyl ester carboxylesterase